MSDHTEPEERTISLTRGNWAWLDKEAARVDATPERLLDVMVATAAVRHRRKAQATERAANMADPCPTCGAVVEGIHTVPVGLAEIPEAQVRIITLNPCGHQVARALSDPKTEKIHWEPLPKVRG